MDFLSLGLAGGGGRGDRGESPDGTPRHQKTQHRASRRARALRKRAGLSVPHTAPSRRHPRKSRRSSKPAGYTEANRTYPEQALERNFAPETSGVNKQLNPTSSTTTGTGVFACQLVAPGTCLGPRTAFALSPFSALPPGPDPAPSLAGRPRPSPAAAIFPLRREQARRERRGSGRAGL